MSKTIRIVSFAGAFISLMALTGCPKPYPNCKSDEACKERKEVCVQGQCRECSIDAHCKTGFVCDSATFRCVPKPECTIDVDCGDSKTCQFGRCVEKPQAATDACTTATDCPEGMECKSGRCATSEKNCDYSPVRFEFNESSLTADAQDRLKALAECIRTEKSKVTLEGHADERGTEEYNLQLSNRRAASVKRYLVNLGVSSGSLDTVGYGEERPAENGATEEAWSANRRVEFKKR